MDAFEGQETIAHVLLSLRAGGTLPSLPSVNIHAWKLVSNKLRPKWWIK